MVRIPLPRLYVNGKFSRIIHPVSVSITDNMIPLSVASITLTDSEDLPADGYVELFNPYGSAGMYRVRMPRDGYGTDTTSMEMEHMIAEVGDYNVKEEISEMMAASTAAQKLFSYYKGGKWKLGKVSDLGSGKVAVESKYDSILTGLLSILSQTPECMMTFDFTTTPWTLNIVKKGTKVVSEGRITRNVETAQVSPDWSTLVTRVWYQTWSEDNDGNITSTWHSKDADTMKTYKRVIERRLDTTTNMMNEEISQMVNTYIRVHQHPRTSVSIRARDLWRITGEKVDKFIVGDLFRLAIQKYSLTLELNITSIVWQDVYGNPDDVIIHLEDEEDTVVSFLHNLDATGEGISGGSGGGGGRAKQSAEWKEFRSKWDVQDNKIEGYVRRLDRDDNILEQAGLQINSKGVLIYADNGSKNTLFSKFKVANDKIEQEVKDRTKLTDTFASRIKQESKKISLVVEEVNGVNVIKSAEIITAINQDGSSILLRADKINLQGYVTMTTFSGLQGTVNSLAAGEFTGVGIRCGTLSINAAQFTLGVSVVWKSTIKDGDGNTVNVMKWG